MEAISALLDMNFVDTGDEYFSIGAFRKKSKWV